MHALGKLHDPRAIEPIVKHLKSGLSYRRGVAADVLGGLGDKRAIVLLTKLLRDCAICRGEKTQPTKKKNSTRIELSQQFALLAGGRDEVTPIWRNKASAKKMPVKCTDSHLSAACFVGQHQIGRSIISNLFVFHFVTQVLIIL
jgi:hypothetical protein